MAGNVFKLKINTKLMALRFFNLLQYSNDSHFFLVMPAIQDGQYHVQVLRDLTGPVKLLAYLAMFLSLIHCRITPHPMNEKYFLSYFFLV